MDKDSRLFAFLANFLQIRLHCLTMLTSTHQFVMNFLGRLSCKND